MTEVTRVYNKCSNTQKLILSAMCVFWANHPDDDNGGETHVPASANEWEACQTNFCSKY